MKELWVLTWCAKLHEVCNFGLNLSITWPNFNIFHRGHSCLIALPKLRIISKGQIKIFSDMEFTGK